jgi:NTP pyrophosphatase (non-canonical NTP hydrolase)
VLDHHGEMTAATEAPPDHLNHLAARLAEFAAARDWGRFHAPKNLASALAVEAAELLEPFQWLTEQQSRELPPDVKDAVALEMADVLLYLVQLGTVLGLDVVAAAHRKIDLNESRFPRTDGTPPAEPTRTNPGPP